jgi:glycosyltransferase involved in cell wall biosynthesis
MKAHKMVPISAVIITFNEEHDIERTLAALDFCNEIIVVDSGSNDATEPMCRKFNCRFMVRPFDGDGPQKRFAISQAVNDWVLVVDADEEVSPELKAEIRSLFSRTSPDSAGFRVPISLVFMGKLLKHGGEYKKTHLRLFNRTKGNYNTNFVHGGASVSGKTSTLQNHLLHYSYAGLHDYLEKFNAYTSASAEALFNKKRRGAVVQSLVRLPLTFIKIYLIKGCFLDGYPGFVWSLLSSFYPVIKFMKLHELYDKNTPRPGKEQ